ncbi:hypothetical protein C8Q73DRAFT_420484 [Cubamyces lactineus]|nr:hypothetical protein C8Q73DRAFT_420484 [Cubamyces lactineus]
MVFGHLYSVALLDTTGIDVWDDANHPLTGKVILGYLIDSESQHLWEDEPLAQGIPFLQKETEVVVPDVPSGTTYFIALEGDSGNWSQLFTIINPAEPSGVAPPSSLVLSTPPANLTSSTAMPSTTTQAVVNTTSAPSSTMAVSNSSNTVSVSPTETKRPSGAAGKRMPAMQGVALLLVICLMCSYIMIP